MDTTNVPRMQAAARTASALALILGIAASAAMAQTGLIPLNDLGNGTYQSFPGGLYPGSSNAPPAAHQAAALQMAAQIVPRNAAGAPDPQGLIVMIAVGMSNTTHEYGAFERNEDANRNRNARLVLMDTAFGGQTAAAIANPSATYWTTMQQRLTSMGLTPAQVQVAWLKEADAEPPDNFPVHAQTLRDELETIANDLHDKFPNLRLCYLSSRIYGGYAAPGSLNPEPQAYESGFAVKWLIESQIQGDPGLNYGQLPGPVRAPLLLWGPYLWADGTNPRSDGLTWVVSDLEADHTHPSPSGEQKVAGLLSSFFAHESTAASWWPARTDAGLVALDAVKDAHVIAASPSTNFGGAATLLEQGTGSPTNIYLGFTTAPVQRPVTLAKLSLRVLGGGGDRLSLVSNTSWSEAGITYASAPPIGSLLMTMPQSSRDGTIAANVTSAVNADADGLLSFALTTSVTGQLTYHSKEDGEPPRLVVMVPCAGGADSDGDGRADVCDCDPAAPSAFAVPREVAALHWLDAHTLGWNAQAVSAGSGTRYDVIGGDLATVATMSGGSCLAGGLVAAQLVDPSAPPAAGAGLYYLVRAANACGKSRYETSSTGLDRITLACP